ncbi:Ig-like domain-containing protein [Streptomyces sp. NPDC053493]|uniref:Ig-like domain-containing protein n=1 Tax=Streptomyces sp. NPDC053493 TaxID=3365705 RepID=UPI0037D29A4C
MSDWYPLTRAWVAHPEEPRYGGHLELFSDADPAAPLAPGQRFHLTLSITPQDAPYRVYGYLLGDIFEDGVLDVVRHKGLGKLANGRYATYSSGAEPRSATLTVKVPENAAEGAYFLPRIVVGVKRTDEERLVPSMAVSRTGFRVRRHWLPGRSMVLAPGGSFMIPGGYSPAEGLRFTGTTFASHGTLFSASDGSLSYQAEAGHLGYDSFSCCFEDDHGHRVWQEITVHIGDLSHAPGAILPDA